jgi:hypothetical protein
MPDAAKSLNARIRQARRGFRAYQSAAASPKRVIRAVSVQSKMKAQESKAIRLDSEVFLSLSGEITGEILRGKPA